MPINQFISLETAIDMTSLYRQEKENILATAYQNQNLLPLAEKFDRTAIETLLQLDGCTAIRIYYGMSEDYKIHAILVAVNEDNEDILPAANTFSTSVTDEEMICESGIRCPEDCDTESPLITDQ